MDTTPTLTSCSFGPGSGCRGGGIAGAGVGMTGDWAKDTYEKYWVKKTSPLRLVALGCFSRLLYSDFIAGTAFVHTAPIHYNHFLGCSVPLEPARAMTSAHLPFRRQCLSFLLLLLEFFLGDIPSCGRLGSRTAHHRGDEGEAADEIARSRLNATVGPRGSAGRLRLQCWLGSS